ncbi:MAG: hypothetical protein J1F35_03330 [Erysipelotrichales bacterium]|nr:hypothetical protein [Erysipelotrichales bacterium]
MTAEEFKKAQEDFRKEIQGKSQKELEALEQEIIKEAEEVDKDLAKAMMKLPKVKNYKEIAEGIRYFLDKQTIQWQYAQAMASMYDFWNPEKAPKEIAYPILHQTLTDLGSMQFTGHDEWNKVIAINNYFEPLRAEYIKLASRPYEVANRHDMVMSALGLGNPVNLAD